MIPAVIGPPYESVGVGGMASWTVKTEDGGIVRFPHTDLGKQDAFLFYAAKRAIPLPKTVSWYDLERLEPLRDLLFVLGLFFGVVAGFSFSSTFGYVALCGAFLAVAYLLRVTNPDGGKKPV